MMLVHHDGDWAIAYNGNRLVVERLAPRRGCALRVRNSSPLANRESGYQQSNFGAYWEGSSATDDGIVFFPDLRYRGVRVRPFMWHPTAQEPLLMVEIDPTDPDLYTRYFVKPPNNHDEMIRALRLEGWEVYDPREVARKYVHVDELEKVEGAPPEGAF